MQVRDGDMCVYMVYPGDTIRHHGMSLHVVITALYGPEEDNKWNIFMSVGHTVFTHEGVTDYIQKAPAQIMDHEGGLVSCSRKQFTTAVLSHFQDTRDISRQICADGSKQRHNRSVTANATKKKKNTDKANMPRSAGGKFTKKTKNTKKTKKK